MGQGFKLKNGSFFIIAEAPGGIYNAEQLRAIADLCAESDVVTKTTEDQRLGLFVAEDQLDHVRTALELVGVGVRNYRECLHQPVACLGAHCPFAEQDALSTALQMTDQFSDKKLQQSVRIGINGCATSCVPSHTLDISVIGEASGYRVYLGGKNSQIPDLGGFVAEGVPADQVNALVEKALDIYAANATEGESLNDYIQRAGNTELVAAFAPYSQDAASGSEDPFGELNQESTNVPSDALLVETEEEVKTAPPPPPIDLDEQLEDITPVGEIISQLSESDESIASEVNQIAEEANSEPMLDLATLDDSSEAPSAEVTSDVVENSQEPILNLGLSPDNLVQVKPEEIQFENDQSIESDELDLTKVEAAVPPNPPAEDGAELELENKLKNSIIEQAKIEKIEPDANEADRLEAMEIMENPGMAPSSDSEPTLDGLSAEAPLNLSLEQDSEEEVILDGESDHSDSQAASGIREAGGFESISSVDINEEFTTLKFDTGASLTIDMQRLRDRGIRRVFKINGQEVSVRLVREGLLVSVDGLEVCYPEAA